MTKLRLDGVQDDKNYRSVLMETVTRDCNTILEHLDSPNRDDWILLQKIGVSVLGLASSIAKDLNLPEQPPIKTYYATLMQSICVDKPAQTFFGIDMDAPQTPFYDSPVTGLQWSIELLGQSSSRGKAMNKIFSYAWNNCLRLEERKAISPIASLWEAFPMNDEYCFATWRQNHLDQIAHEVKLFELTGDEIEIRRIKSNYTQDLWGMILRSSSNKTDLG